MYPGRNCRKYLRQRGGTTPLSRCNRRAIDEGVRGHHSPGTMREPYRILHVREEDRASGVVDIGVRDAVPSNVAAGSTRPCRTQRVVLANSVTSALRADEYVQFAPATSGSKSTYPLSQSYGPPRPYKVPCTSASEFRLPTLKVGEPHALLPLQLRLTRQRLCEAFLRHRLATRLHGLHWFSRPPWLSSEPYRAVCHRDPQVW